MLLSREPLLLGPPALVATMQPGVAHNAQRLLSMRKREHASASCKRGVPPRILPDSVLQAAFAQLMSMSPSPSTDDVLMSTDDVLMSTDDVRMSMSPSPSSSVSAAPPTAWTAWHALALDDAPSSAAVVDEFISRVPEAKATVEALLSTALRRVHAPNVALRLATRHHQGAIDVEPLLELHSDTRDPRDPSGPPRRLSHWVQLGLNPQGAGLVEFLIGCVPRLRSSMVQVRAALFPSSLPTLSLMTSDDAVLSCGALRPSRPPLLMSTDEVLMSTDEVLMRTDEVLMSTDEVLMSTDEVLMSTDDASRPTTHTSHSRVATVHSSSSRRCTHASTKYYVGSLAQASWMSPRLPPRYSPCCSRAPSGCPRTCTSTRRPIVYPRPP